MAKMAVSGSAPSLILVLHLSLSLILSSGGEADCADAPLPPRASPIFVPPDEGEVRDYFIRKNGTEAQADPGSGRSMNPTAGGWARTPAELAGSGTVWMAATGAGLAPAETYVPKNKAFYATRPPEQAKDFLKDAALRRQAMRKRKEAVTQ